MNLKSKKVVIVGVVVVAAVLITSAVLLSGWTKEESQPSATSNAKSPAESTATTAEPTAEIKKSPENKATTDQSSDSKGSDGGSGTTEQVIKSSTPQSSSSSSSDTIENTNASHDSPKSNPQINNVAPPAPPQVIEDTNTVKPVTTEHTETTGNTGNIVSDVQSGTAKEPENNKGDSTSESTGNEVKSENAPSNSSEGVVAPSPEQPADSNASTSANEPEAAKPTFDIIDEQKKKGDIYYGVLDVKLHGSTDGHHKVFYKSADKDKLENFVKSLKMSKAEIFAKESQTDLEAHWNLVEDGEAVFSYIEGKENDPLYTQIHRRGLIGYLEDLNASDAGKFEKKKLFFIVPSTIAGDLKLAKFEDIDLSYSAVGPDESIVKDILSYEVGPETREYKLRVTKIENFLKRKELNALHIEFGKDLRTYTTGADYGFRNLMEGGKQTVYDDIIVSHNFKSSGYENDILTVLDTIKSDGLKKELKRETKAYKDGSIKLSVLLISNQPEGLKAFEDKLTEENENFSGIRCGINQDFFCDALEVEVTGESTKKYKIFFTYGNKSKLEEIRTKFRSGLSEADFLKNFEEFEQQSIDASKYYCSKNDKNIYPLEIVSQIKRRGFKTVADQQIDSDDFFVVVPENAVKYKDCYLISLDGIDYKTAGTAEVKSDKTEEIILQEADYFKPRYSAYVHEIDNVFGHSNLKALFIRFGLIDLNSIFAINEAAPIAFKTEDFASYEKFTKTYKGTANVDFDHLLVMHTHKKPTDDIYKVIDGIKADASKEFLRQKSLLGNDPEYYLFVGGVEELRDLKKSLEKQFKK